MKILITVITSLLTGLTLASTDFSPLRELHNLFTNKRRILITLGVAVTGFLLLFSGFIMGLVEGSLQYDAQGFLIWSSLFTVAAGLAIVGAFCMLAAWATFPQPQVAQHNVFAELNSQFRLTELAEQFFKELGERMETRPPESRPHSEDKFSEVHTTEEPQSQPLHH